MDPHPPRDSKEANAGTDYESPMLGGRVKHSTATLRGGNRGGPPQGQQGGKRWDRLRKPFARRPRKALHCDLGRRRVPSNLKR